MEVVRSLGLSVRRLVDSDRAAYVAETLAALEVPDYVLEENVEDSIAEFRGVLNQGSARDSIQSLLDDIQKKTRDAGDMEEQVSVGVDRAVRDLEGEEFEEEDDEEVEEE